MRLSDAIALGRVLHQPWYIKEDGFRGGNACAMELAGAAANGSTSNWLSKDWSWAGEGTVELPCKCITGLGVGMETQDRAELSRLGRLSIIHLFNHHVVTHKDWTLDQLIDWVRSVEPQETATLNVQLAETETVKVLA